MRTRFFAFLVRANETGELSSHRAETTMERLWAPWRMKYILNPKKSAGCILCEELKKDDDRKNYILHRGRHSFVIMNLYPYNNGHLLIVPNAHEADIDKLPVDGLTDLMKTTQASVDILRRAMNPEGFNIGINIGKPAGAGIPQHLHIQIVPRWTGDASYITVFDETRVISELLDGTYERLKPYFEKLIK
jgi:ATP adenylyltransferase